MDKELKGEYQSAVIMAREVYKDKDDFEKLKLSIQAGRNRVRDIIRQRQRYNKMFECYPEYETSGDQGGISIVESKLNMEFLKSKLNSKESHVFIRIISGDKVKDIRGLSKRSVYRILNKIKGLYLNL